MSVQWQKIYARLLAVMLLIVLVSGCGNAQVTRCEAPRPEICIEQFEPVCATQQNGARVDYPNACYACRDKQVVSHTAGQCQ